MALKYRCCFCLSLEDAKHATNLFTMEAKHANLLGCLGPIFLVALTENDGLPSHVCRSCKRRAFTVEKKLQELRCMAKESMKKLHDIGQERRKRPKDTSSGAGVSPHTAAARPPAKRTHLLGKQLFAATPRSHSALT